MQEAAMLLLIFTVIIGAPYVIGPWVTTHVPLWVTLSAVPGVLLVVAVWNCLRG